MIKGFCKPSLDDIITYGNVQKAQMVVIFMHQGEDTKTATLSYKEKW